MKLNPKQETEAILDVFDDIGEYENWDGKTVGFGPKKMAQFLDENPGIGKIHMRVNSLGGYVFDGLAVLNLLKSSGKKIDVEIIGIAASMASVIAMAGDTIRIHDTAQMMIHNCWTWVCGNAKEMRQEADRLDKLMESSKIAYLSKAGKKLTREKLDELLDAEDGEGSWLSAKECVEYGLADEICEEDSEENDGTESLQKSDKEPFQKTDEVEKAKPPKTWFGF